MSAILDYLTGPDDPGSLVQAVETLVQRRGAQRLQAALSDELACADCQARLAEHAQAEDLATPLSPELQEVAQHLAHCEACSADYAALQLLSQAGEADDPSTEPALSLSKGSGRRLAEIPVPEPDLSFLHPAPLAITNLWRQVEATRRQLVADIRVTISRVTIQFGALPGGLVPQPVPIPVLRDATTTGPAQRLTLPDVPGNLAFELTVSPAAENAQVVLGVFQADTQQPVARVAVTLLNAQGQRLRRADTGAEGRVTFGDLPPGRYGLQVRTPDGQWELGLVLTESHPSADV